jgi:penicillin-binding protein 1A
MNDSRRSARNKRASKQLGRKSKNTYVMKSGKSIKVNRSLSHKLQARKDTLARSKALRLAGMPKSRIRRLFYRLHPKRMYQYWFSREGGIMALKITGIGIVAGFLLLIGLFAYFRKDLPNLRDISGSSLGGSIRYYDRTGETMLWEDFDAVKRIPVPEDNISEHIKDATLAVEDKDFFKHSGFDVRGITRAAFNNALGGDSRQGGSTVTQQLVRLTQQGVGQEQTYQRKIKELILSIELERSYTKQEILTGYLNSAPYGNIQYGVETAARDYFQKPAKDLTLDEAAFLAAIPKSPSIYSPYGPRYSKEALVGRQHYILDLMEEQGMITPEERDEAKRVDTTDKVHEVKPKYDGMLAPWFVLTAKERLEDKFGDQTVQRGGWKVITTLDLDKQKIAEEEVTSGIQQVIRQGGNSAAFVAQDVKTGQVVSLVGGSDFNNEVYGQNNYARYRLPPGSSFKPYDYLALIEHTENNGAGSVLYDTQGPLEGYSCTIKRRPKDGGNCLYNYDFRYPGPMTLRYALGGSRNIPAVKAMLTVGVDKTIETAESLGLTSGYRCFLDEDLTEEGPCYASSAIGDGAYLRLDEHVHAFSTISRNGNKIPQTYILKIEDAAGKIVEEWQPSPGEQVVRPEAAYIVADMMADPNASYMSRKIHNYKGHRFSVKTGTTNDAKDGWLMGFSTQYSAGVWVGYHNRQVEMSGFMENMTQPIWTGWMNRIHDDIEPIERPRPNGVQVLPAFVVRSHVGVASVEPSPKTDLFPAWYKQGTRRSNEKRVIDIVSNKLATDCTPDRAKKEVDEADANTFSSDRFVGGNNTNSSDSDDVHKCDDRKPSIKITESPHNCSGNCAVTVTVQKGTHPLSSDNFPGTINVIIDGRTVRSFSAANSGTFALTFNYSRKGNKAVRVEIIDSVLYDASALTQIVFNSSGGGGGSDDDPECEIDDEDCEEDD